MLGNSSVAAQLAASQEGLNSVELVYFYFRTSGARNALHVYVCTTKVCMKKKLASIQRFQVLSLFHFIIVEFESTVPL
jgi:hypothetical protein